MQGYLPDDSGSPFGSRGKIPRKLSRSELSELLDEEDLRLLRFEINCCLMHFIEQDKPVYLEGLGLLIPQTVSRLQIHASGRWALLRKELCRSIRLEKCDDFSCLPGRQGTSAADTKDLASRVYTRLPIRLQFKLTESDLKRILKAWLYDLRAELIERGYCHALSSIGSLYALHNRQGSSLEDRFAGADIFLRARHQQLLRVLQESLIERAVLRDAWEILEAAFGEKVFELQFSPAEHLRSLGIDCDGDATIKVGGFHHTQRNRLIFSTDGLRDRRADRNKAGTELVFQIPFQPLSPSWIRTPFSLGWYLLEHAKQKTLKPGIGLSAFAPLDHSQHSQIRSILSTRFSDLGSEQVSCSGRFHFINLVGITEDESALLVRHMRPYLMAILEHKQLDQVTFTDRSSVLRNTDFSPLEVPDEPRTRPAGSAEAA